MEKERIRGPFHRLMNVGVVKAFADVGPAHEARGLAEVVHRPVSSFIRNA
jgi:hypothetical protein